MRARQEKEGGEREERKRKNCIGLGEDKRRRENKARVKSRRKGGKRKLKERKKTGRIWKGKLGENRARKERSVKMVINKRRKENRNGEIK